MALDVRKGSDGITAALVSQHNALLKKVASELTTEPHADVTSLTSGDWTSPEATPLVATSPTADTIGKVKTLANELKRIYNVHIADALAHDAADDENTVEDDDATDQTTANTLLNSLKAAYNAHLTESGVHYTNDTTNAVTADDADGLAKSETLANELKTKFNAHVQFAIGVSALNLVEP